MGRPHLEYAHFIWSPFRKKDVIVIIVNVQKRATQMLPIMKNLRCTERLNKLDLPTLLYRHIGVDVIEVFKMMNGRYDQEVEMQLPLKGNNTRGHQKKFNKKRYRTKIRQFQFWLRVVDSWNSLSLPDYVVEAPSLKSFER